MGSPSFDREYDLKYVGKIGNVFHQKDIERALMFGRQYEPDLVNPKCPKSLGIDPAFGSSRFAFVLTQMRNGKIEILYADEFDRPDFNEMIDKALELMHRYRRTKVFVDASNPAIVTGIKHQLGERTDYEEQIANLKKHHSDPSSSAGIYLFTFTRNGIDFVLFIALGTSGMAIPSGVIATWNSMVDGIVAPRTEFEGFFQTGWNSLASVQANQRFVGNYESKARRNSVAPVRAALSGLGDSFFSALHSVQQSERRLDSSFQAYSEATLGAHDEVDESGNSFYVPNSHEYWFYDSSTEALYGNDTGENPDPTRNFRLLHRPRQ